MRPTVRDIKKVAASVGATVEEDTGDRDMRVFQVIAPDCKVFEEGLHMLRVEWGRGSDALAFNLDTLADLKDRVKGGLIPDPEAVTEVLMTWQIWSEGYTATGESGRAMLHGAAKGRTFKDACVEFARTNLEFHRYFDPNRLTYWGCRLFDNGVAARRSFG